MILTSNGPPHLRTAESGLAQRQAFSLVEAVISIVIVAGMFVAALTTVAAARRTEQTIESRSRAELLAQGLMSEILCKSYEDPDGNPQFGRESGEGSASRAQWDDVDDYHQWSSCPPRDRDGSILLGLEEYSRSVEVVFVYPKDSSVVVSTDTGVKRITVTVRRKGLKLAEMVALRTEAWPVDEEEPLKVLFVVTDTETPDAEELARQTLMESWGFVVNRIAASASQSAFDAAASDADVAYVSERIHGSDLNTKLRDTTIGVVNEEMDLYDDLGFASGRWWYANKTVMNVVDNTHYMTSPFSLGGLTIFSPKQSLTGPVNKLAAGLRVLGENPNGNWPVLTVLETGTQLYGGGTAAGRRVQLPWAESPFSMAVVTADGLTIMKRAIEWAGHKEQTP